MVDNNTGKRIDIIVWPFQDCDVEVTKTQKPTQKRDDNKEKELKVGDNIVVVGKFVKSR